MDYVSLNGQIMPYEDAHIAPGDAGLLHGVGLFETMRTYNGKIFRLHDHLERLNASALELGLPVTVTVEQIEELLPDLLSSNDLDPASNGAPNKPIDARIRLTITPGDPHLSSIVSATTHEHHQPAVTFLLTATELKPYPAELYEKGMSAIISSYKANPFSPLAGHKTTSYFEKLLALREAHQAACGEAFWFTPRNETLTEGCISNVFIVDAQGLLATPPLTITSEALGLTPKATNGSKSGIQTGKLCLPGTARKVVLELATQANILPHERLITIDDLLKAREVFITNSLMGLMPIVRVEGHAVSDEKPGPLTRQLMQAYTSATLAE